MRSEITLAELAGDPHPHLARLRAEAPVAHVPALGGWLVTGRAAAVATLHDPATFTVDDARFSTAQVVGTSMLSTDGAAHARHREPFVAPFRPRRVHDRYSAAIAGEVDRRLDRIAASPSRTAELRAELAGPVAAAAVADALGLDGRDHGVVDRLLGWYREIVESVSGVAAGRPVTQQGATAMASLRRSLEPVLAGPAGRSLLADAMVTGRLTADEVVADAAVIMFGGIETTEGMILNALWHILQEPGLVSALGADQQLVTSAVEESLRLEPAAAVVDRYATRAVTLEGADIAPGDLVVVSLAGANRDPEEFPEPDRFDLRRPNLRRQLAFAVGPHVCLGMDLARLEARTAVAAVLARLPGVQLDDDAPGPTGLVFRKPSWLPAHWG